MKTILIYICAVATLTGCAVYKQDLTMKACSPSSDKTTYTKASELQQALDQIVKQGVPGVSLAVYAEDQMFTASAGLAKIEDQTPMHSCHLQYLQSVAKNYMAVIIMQLYEQGRIDLESPMTKYLPSKYSRYIADADKVTVRMLLNHTSGVPEYNMQPSYITKLLQHPDYIFTEEEYLQYIDGMPLTFVPGSKYSYRNTNYVLLSLIGDALTGDHTVYMVDHIFKPLNLTQTYYRGDRGYLNYPNLVNSYWDRHSDGILENASQLQRNNVASLVGDDGIVATPGDAVLYLKGLMEGKLISPATLEVMKTWAKDSKGNPTYGLGLDYSTMGGQPAYGHSGGGIGAGCQLYYFPEKNLYMFIGINLGTVTASPIHEEVGKTLDKIHGVLLR